MQLIHAVILVGVLGAGAGAAPPNHHHQHNHLHHQKRAEGGRFVKAVHTTYMTVTVTAEFPPSTPLPPSPPPPVATPTSVPQPPPSPVQAVVPVPPKPEPEPEPEPKPESQQPAPQAEHAPAPAPAPAPKPEPAPQAAPAAAQAPAPASAPNAGSGQFVPFCGGNSKRATAAQIAAVGNIGVKYGCNMMSIAEDIAPMYDYKMTFTNVAQQPFQLVCFNKIGRDGGVNGFFKGQGESIDVQVAPGESHLVAFQPDSLGSCAFGENKIELSPIGQYLGTWAEFSFGDAGNGGWSGADCSSLAASTVPGAAIPGCRMCLEGSSAKCSTIFPGGAGDNAFTRGMEADDGVGLNISPVKNIDVVVQMGYSG